MKEEEVGLALSIMNRRIAQFIKNNKEKDINVFKKQLMKLKEEEEKIYQLDEETIKKVFNIYLKELKS